MKNNIVFSCLLAMRNYVFCSCKFDANLQVYRCLQRSAASPMVAAWLEDVANGKHPLIMSDYK